MEEYKGFPERLVREVSIFEEDMEHENDLQVILRSHIYIEHEIEKLLDLVLVNKKIIFGGFAAFKSKLNMVVGLGLMDEEDSKVYIKITDIRNKYAHKLDYVFTKEDLNALIQSFGPTLKEKYEWSREQEGFNLKEESIILQLRGIIQILWLDLKLLVESKTRRYMIEQLALMNQVIKNMKEQGPLGKEFVELASAKSDEIHEEIERGNYNVSALKELRKLVDHRYYSVKN